MIDPAVMNTLWNEREKAGVERMLAASAVGGPDTARHQLGDLLERTRADELIVACAVHEHAARLRSYELLAELAASA